MENVNQLEHQIETDWIQDPNKIAPYDFVIDKVGDATVGIMECGEYMRQLAVSGFISDFTEAIAYGFDDMKGFTFFYLVKHLTKNTNILARLYKIKHGRFPHQNNEPIEQ